MKSAVGKTIKVEWCENWIRKTFASLPSFANGIERTCFFREAEKAGLYVQGSYGSPMSEAICRLLTVESVHDDLGKFLYYVFRLKSN